MAFIDEIKIQARAGRGGNGVVRWLHEKGKEFSGPSGGNGGKGGDVYIKGVRDIGRLSGYAHQKEFEAPRGGDGMKNSRHGAAGEDLVIDLPIGSIITNLSNEKHYRLDKEGEEILILKGGNGGLGNEHFKASTNTSPKESTDGKPGEEAEFYIELELVANAGFAGLPNAGKSSLLNALTNARSKVGAYAFTTIEPALGDMEGFILADIPGLIEGASEGRGLGHKFLRHIRRTSLVLHCISFENEDADEVYKTIRNELAAFDPILAAKKEIIILTKSDVVTPEAVEERMEHFKKKAPFVFSVSILDDASVKALKDGLVKILRTESM